MKEYLYNLWDKFKKATIKFKIFVCFLIVLYIGIICVSLIPIKVDASIPGSVTNVSKVISIESENNSGDIYTVSIYSKNKVSILEYLLIKLDKNSDVELGESVTFDIFTENEDYASNVGYKVQSIQDSLIVAYNAAKDEGYDVNLDYSYTGQYLINIPQNLFKTGSEDFKNSDVVKGYNGLDFTSSKDYYSTLDTIFSNISYNGESIKSLKENGRFQFHKEDGSKNDDNLRLIYDVNEYLKTLTNDKTFKIIRNKDDKEITPSYTMLFYLYTNIVIKSKEGIANYYTIYDSCFDYFTINYDKCNPKIDISKTNTVGPSGGLMQTLAVYNSITNDDITKGKRIIGTGGIQLDGKVTSIGGERQKIVTANLYGAEIFFVPSANYESAKEKYNEIKDISFQLVSVNNFKDVLNYLNNMEVNNE